MGSAKKSSTTARQARIAEMRRAEEARTRRNRILTVALSTVVVAGLVVGGVFLVRSQSDDSDGMESKGDGTKTSGKFATDADGLRTWKGDLGRNHVTEKVTYPVEPPSEGTTTRSG